MKPFQQIADCSVPDDATRVIEKHYGLETLSTYRDCTIAGAYRHEVEPNPRAIYQAYAFKNKALLFIQVLQMPIPKTERRDPLEVKGNLERLALQAVIDRIDTGDFEVGEQYDALLLKAGERAVSKLRDRRAACEDLAHDDRDSSVEKERDGEPDTFMPQANGSRPEHAAGRPSSKIPSAPHSDEEHEAQPRPDDGLKAKNTLPRVLVIDRDSATQYQIRLVLKDLCETSAAYTGGLAFHYLESQLNVLIITAMELPNGYSGRGLLHAIKAMEGYEHVPVIGMTTTGDRSEDPDDVLREGFDAYFHKPLDLQALRETVQRLLRVGSTSLVNKIEEEGCI